MPTGNAGSTETYPTDCGEPSPQSICERNSPETASTLESVNAATFTLNKGCPSTDGTGGAGTGFTTTVLPGLMKARFPPMPVAEDVAGTSLSTTVTWTE